MNRDEMIEVVGEFLCRRRGLPRDVASHAEGHAFSEARGIVDALVAAGCVPPDTLTALDRLWALDPAAHIQGWLLEGDGSPTWDISGDITQVQAGTLHDALLAALDEHPCVLAGCTRTGEHETHIGADGTQFTFTAAHLASEKGTTTP